MTRVTSLPIQRFAPAHPQSPLAQSPALSVPAPGAHAPSIFAAPTSQGPSAPSFEEIMARKEAVAGGASAVQPTFGFSELGVFGLSGAVAFRNTPVEAEGAHGSDLVANRSPAPSASKALELSGATAARSPQTEQEAAPTVSAAHGLLLSQDHARAIAATPPPTSSQEPRSTFASIGRPRAQAEINSPPEAALLQTRTTPAGAAGVATSTSARHMPAEPSPTDIVATTGEIGLALPGDQAAAAADNVDGVQSPRTAIEPVAGARDSELMASARPASTDAEPFEASGPDGARSEPPPPPRLKQVSAQAQATSNTDLNLVVAQSDGEAQVAIAAPALSPEAQARLRQVAEAVAADFGLTLTELSFNGAALERAPTAAGGQNAGRFTY